MNWNPPGSSVHGISQTRILGWVAIPFSRGSSQLRNGTHVCCIVRRVLYYWATRAAQNTDFKRLPLMPMNIQWGLRITSGQGIKQRKILHLAFFNLEKNKSGLANANPHYMIIVHFWNLIRRGQTTLVARREVLTSAFLNFYMIPSFSLLVKIKNYLFTLSR